MKQVYKLEYEYIRTIEYWFTGNQLPSALRNVQPQHHHEDYQNTINFQSRYTKKFNKDFSF